MPKCDFNEVESYCYPYCSLVAFCAFAWLRLCAFGASGAFSACKIFS